MLLFASAYYQNPDQMNKFTLFILVVIMIATGYNRTNKYSYAIRDFKKTLQPYLTEVVSKGIVGYDTTTYYINLNATDKELRQLSRCEHPVLRAVALRGMLSRPSFNHYEVVMNNLDDTAMVAVDWGEWGLKYFRVSDDMLHESKWKDTM